MRSALSWPARPSAVLRDLAQSPDLPAPTRPTRRPTSDPAACWSLHCHQPQHRLLPTSLCRVEPLEQVPLERLDAGLGDGVAPTKAQLETPLLADVFAHDAVVLRALRGRLSTKSKLRRRGSRLRSLRSPHRSLPLRWLVALLPGSSKRRCNSRQRSRLWKRHLTSSPGQEKLFIWPPFFQIYITNVFCAKKRVGHACICPMMVTG